MSDELAASVRELAGAIRELAQALSSPRARAPAAPAPAAGARVAARAPLSVDGPVANTDAGLGASEAAPAPADPLAEARALIAEAFRLACLEDDDAVFEAFVGLFHTERMSPPRAVPTLREFAWRSIRRRVGDYVADPGDPSGFEVARTEPAQLGPQASAFRLFVAARGRSATPIAFKRDDDRQGSLRVTDCSL